MNRWLSAMLFLAACLSTLSASPAAEVKALPDCSFKLTVVTSARKSTIWKLWTDVENWRKYDTILEYSYLADNAEFRVGAVGYVKAKGAPKTRFELIEVNQSVSFIERLKLPLFQSIELQRYFEINDNGETAFTHEVNFRGPLKYIVYFIAAATFRKELPLVMGRLKDLAESEEQRNASGAGT